MKSNPIRTLLLAIAAVALLATAPQLRADNRHGGHNDGHYQHDRSGYWDANHRHHPYIVRNGHHGYWWNHVWVIVD